VDDKPQKKFANEPKGAARKKHKRASPEQMRAMVHPIRMRLIDALRTDGPSTATRLAGELGESSGSTSYHLRVLAEAGVIEEDGERGNARDRWWRLAGPLFFPTDAKTPEERALELSARTLHLERDDEAVRRFLLASDELPTEWNAAAFTGSFALYLTADELLRFGLDFMARVAELQRSSEERPEGARRVMVALRAVPWLGDDAQ
jgi:DNA-binding transcriptional ArsR family regulator